MKDPVKTKIRANGLRYESKTVGTEFSAPFGSTMSCFQCARHVSRSRLESFMLAGTRQYRCKGGCC